MSIVSESRPARVFFSYAPADRELRDELINHLAMLRRNGILDAWHDELVDPGAPWRPALEQAIDTADVVLLLVSADYQASDECFVKQMQRALERQREKKAQVIPVLLRPCAWDGTPFADLQPLPSNRVPITKWSNRDDAFLDVANGIQHALDPSGILFHRRKRSRVRLAATLIAVLLVGVIAMLVALIQWNREPLPTPAPSSTSSATPSPPPRPTVDMVACDESGPACRGSCPAPLTCSGFGSTCQCCNPRNEVPPIKERPLPKSEWEKACKVNTQGAGSQPENCEMYILGQWVRIVCTGGYTDVREQSELGPQGAEYFETINSHEVKVVFALKKGRAQRLKICRPGGSAMLFANWPVSQDKPVHIALGKGSACK